MPAVVWFRSHPGANEEASSLGDDAVGFQDPHFRTDALASPAAGCARG